MAPIIYMPGTDSVIAACKGPDADGRCPLAVEGKPPPCAGNDVLLSRDEPAADDGKPRTRLSVVEKPTRCPLRWVAE